MIALATAALSVCVLVLIGAGLLVHRLLVHLDQLGLALREQESIHRRERAALLGVLAAERREHREEIAEMLNRIQHPRVYQPSPEQLRIEQKRHEEHIAAVDDEFEMVGQSGLIMAEANGSDGG